MTTEKKRVLYVGESSFLKSGYGVYAAEILRRINETNKYTLAEFGSFGKANDPRDGNVKWRYYGNVVEEGDPRYPEFKSRPRNNFGEWRFEHVILDFKPDIIMSIRDFWMDSYIRTSPLRDFYHWVWMPTLDSVPCRPEWIDDLLDCDGVMAWSEWAIPELEKQGGSDIKLNGIAPPGTDLDLFKPVKDKRAHKAEHGLEEDIYIVGTVMRNQRRKLYPDLFKAFRKFLDTYPELGKKTYLYCHCKYPDKGWEIPTLLKQEQISHKVLFSYKCQHCGTWFPSLFRDAKAVCIRCNYVAAVMPGTGDGLDEHSMVQLFNLFDLYIQYATNEGFGMPVVEAASCGVPAAAVNHTAMKDSIKNTNGYPLRVHNLFLDPEVTAWRAMPDNDHPVEVIHDFLSLPTPLRLKKGLEAREGVKEHYDYANTAKVWEDYFDKVELTRKQGKWDSPADIHTNIPNEIPPNLSNLEFAHWIMKAVYRRPDLIHTYFFMQLLQDLNYEARIVGQDTVPITRENIFQNAQTLALNKNHCEKIRTGQLHTIPSDFIEYAELKERFLK